MSKQFYVAKAVDNAHETDIFSLAVTPTSVLSGSGASTLRIHSTNTADFSIAQSINGAHKLGCHHIATSKGGPGRVACSAGFGGEVKVWRYSEAGDWSLDVTLMPADLAGGGATAGTGSDSAGTGDADANAAKAEKTTDAWALALSTDERYLAYTTHSGRVGVWDLQDNARVVVFAAQNRATSSFAMAVDLSQDGCYTAVGYQNGSVSVFHNEQAKLVYALPGLAKPVRAVAFSPLGKRLAAAGDAGVISLYDMKHGDPVGSLVPPPAPAAADGGSSGAAESSSGGGVWVLSLDFSASGEYLLAGYMDGRVRVWNTELGTCVATSGDSDLAATIWSVKWLPPRSERQGADTESFCIAGADRRITFYREAGSNPII